MAGSLFDNDVRSVSATVRGPVQTGQEVCGIDFIRLPVDGRHQDGAVLRAALRSLAGRLLERAGTPVGDAGTRPLADPLSPRELEVLRLLDGELTGPQIARELYVSDNTLRTHTKRICTKLDVTTRAAAVRRAHERGLL
jgi:LuxR family maltose regulon positive regulatory protein